MNILHSRQERVEVEFTRAVESALGSGGAAYANFSLCSFQTAALQRQAMRVPRDLPASRPIRRDIDEWSHTERATFVPPSRYLLRRPKEAGALNYLWMPEAAKITRHFARHIRGVGRYMGLPTLADWTPNRDGINYMHGTPEEPAEIGEHTDVENELGLVIAFDISGGKRNGQPHLILGHDTCKAAGIEQPPHEVIATTERMGMTIAQLDF